MMCMLMLCVNICDNGVIHWAVVAHSFHIFSFIVRRIALHYTELRLAGCLFKSLILLTVVLHIEQVLSLKIMCEHDTWFKCLERLFNSVMTCFTWYSACHVFVDYYCCYDYLQYMLKKKRKEKESQVVAP